MRLLRLRANQPGFHEVAFRDGFNIVIAERTKEATKKDSRNGLGKSTFIELIHFCLGKGAQKGQVPVIDDLAEWSFTLDVELFGDEVALTRRVDNPKRVAVSGNFDRWPIEPTWDPDTSTFFISIGDLRDVVARGSFGIGSEEASAKYSPTLGSLLGYFSRRGRDAYSSPFEHHRKQLEWDKQVNVAFLLGLNWQDAAAWQTLKDEKKVLDQLGRAVKEGMLPDYLGTEGALETERVRLAEDIAEQERRLASFQVHENYRDIEGEANALTEQLHQLANANFSDSQSVALYHSAAEEEAAGTATRDQLEAVFKEVNLRFPESVSRRLDEVAVFHKQVIANRREYLLTEVSRLERVIRERNIETARLDERRASLMAVLDTHRALDEFQQLQGRMADTKGSLRDIEARMARLREFTESKSRHADKVRELEVVARQSYEELREQRDRGIRYFNSNTEVLYETPGRLIIDITSTGFRFGVDIERARSAGVSNMKVFCFDLTLMQLWAGRSLGPGFLIHDSLLYDGVDERQKALSLHLAAREAERLNWQYICTFNSDEYPEQLLAEDSAARSEPILTLTDSKEDGMLLGKRFS
jgi:uncharacterized protein YydD (DUF2326 family)